MRLQAIGTYARRLIQGPTVKSIYLASKSLVPYAAAGAAGAVLYHVCPEVKDKVDAVREFAHHYQRATEAITGGFFCGFLPDRLAQATEGHPWNLRRGLGMAALGAFATSVMLRGWYNFANMAYPDTDAASTVKKVLMDQGVYTPLFYCLYFPVVNFIQRKPWLNVGNLWKKIAGILPRNWVYWGLIGTPIVYNLPADLMVYANITFNLIWLAYLSKRAYAEPPLQQ